MTCYRCGSTDLVLAPLTPAERAQYPAIGVTLRSCRHCGLEQSHWGHDETVTPQDAAKGAMAK